MFCVFQTDDEGRCRCQNCGLTIKAKGACHKVKSRCKGQASALGDCIERWLARNGIDKAWYGAVKQTFGLPPDCGCDERKEWFNKVGRWLGIGE